MIWYQTEHMQYSASSTDLNWSVRRIGSQWFVACSPRNGGMPVILDQSFSMETSAMKYAEIIDATPDAA